MRIGSSAGRNGVLVMAFLFGSAITQPALAQSYRGMREPDLVSAPRLIPPPGQMGHDTPRLMRCVRPSEKVIMPLIAAGAGYFAGTMVAFLSAPAAKNSEQVTNIRNAFMYGGAALGFVSGLAGVASRPTCGANSQTRTP